LGFPSIAQRLLPFDPAFDNRIDSDRKTVGTVTVYETWSKRRFLKTRGGKPA
jgi:hypothetical protein